jgi:glyoxylase-like metal-dependent hydrolase (beta-lactamase superfamily II)
MSKINLETVVSTLFEENCFVVNLPGRDDCLIIDPGLEPKKVVQLCQNQGWTPSTVLVTHGHVDHIGGIATIKEQWPEVQILLGEHEAEKLTDPDANMSAQFGTPFICPRANETLTDGQTFTAAGIEIEVRELPGHSCGHVIYLVRATEPITAFVGDVIFAGSIGRADFPDSDEEMLHKGIREKIYTLPNDTILYPGHGPETTVGHEKRTNPFVRGN